MDLPLKVHIARIQRELEEFDRILMKSTDRATANAAEANIRALRLALTHYELALRLENEVLAKKAEFANSLSGSEKSRTDPGTKL